MSHNTMNILPDNLETNITDITITPDGRIRCFGLSRQLLALLCETGLADEQLQKHWEMIKEATNTIREAEPAPAAVPPANRADV